MHPILLALLIPAHASEPAPPPPIPDAAAWADTDAWRTGARPPIPGIRGIEATLAERGGDLRDVTIVSADWDAGLLAPIRSRAEGRTRAWRDDFGHDRLMVRHRRASDGAVLAASLATADLANPPFDPTRERLCASAPATDPREFGLAAWDDHARPRFGFDENDAARASTLVLLDEGVQRTALVQLAPGESATVVEIEGPLSRRQPRRRIEVHRGDRTLTMTEGATQQRVCLEIGDGPSWDDGLLAP